MIILDLFSISFRKLHSGYQEFSKKAYWYTSNNTYAANRETVTEGFPESVVYLFNSGSMRKRNTMKRYQIDMLRSNMRHR